MNQFKITSQEFETIHIRAFSAHIFIRQKYSSFLPVSVKQKIFSDNFIVEKPVSTRPFAVFHFALDFCNAQFLVALLPSHSSFQFPLLLFIHLRIICRPLEDVW